MYIGNDGFITFSALNVIQTSCCLELYLNISVTGTPPYLISSYFPLKTDIPVAIFIISKVWVVLCGRRTCIT